MLEGRMEGDMTTQLTEIVTKKPVRMRTNENTIIKYAAKIYNQNENKKDLEYVLLHNVRRAERESE